MTLPVLYMRRVKEAFEDLCIYLYIRTYWTHYGISFRLHLLIAGVNTEGRAYSLSGIYHSHFHSTCIIIFYSNHSADLEIWTDILTYRMYWRMPVISMNVSISLRIVRERDRVHGQSSPSSMQRKQKKKERVEKEKKTRRFYIVYLVMVLLYERIGSKQWSLSNRKKRFSLFNQTSYRHSCEYTCIYYAAFFLSCSASTLYCRSSNCCSYPYRILSLATIDSLEWWLHSIAQLYVERERKLPWNVTVETKRRKRKSWHCE